MRLVHERFQRAGGQQEWLQSELSKGQVIGKLLHQQIQYKAAEQMYLHVLGGYDKALVEDNSTSRG